MEILDEKTQINILGLGFNEIKKLNRKRYLTLDKCYYNIINNNSFSLQKEELFSKWSFNVRNSVNEICILREFDRKGFNHVNDISINPVSLFFTKYPNDPYVLHLHIHSFDGNSAHSFYFVNSTKQDCENLREYFIQWFEINKIVIIPELIKKCMELNAIDESY